MMTHRSVFPKLAVFPIDLRSMMELSSSKKFPSYGHLTGLCFHVLEATYRPKMIGIEIEMLVTEKGVDRVPSLELT